MCSFKKKLIKLEAKLLSLQEEITCLREEIFKLKLSNDPNLKRYIQNLNKESVFDTLPENS